MSDRRNRKNSTAILLGSAIAMLLTFACSRISGDSMNHKKTIIDTHIHLWNYPRLHGEVYPSPDKHPIKWLMRHFSMADYAAADAGEQVMGVVLIEACGGPSGDQLIASNERMFELADQNETILGVVGKLDLLSDSFESDLATLMKHDSFVGLRTGGSIFDDEGELREEALEAMNILESKNLSLDIIGVKPSKLAKVADQLPKKLPIILDHFSHKDLTLSVKSEWREALAILASLPNLHLKVSDIQLLSFEQFDVDPLDQFNGIKSPEAYRDILDTVFTIFGSERLIFGSNWPVSNRAGPFSDQIAILDDFLSDKPNAVRDSIYFKNAIKAYSLKK